MTNGDKIKKILKNMVPHLEIEEREQYIDVYGKSDEIISSKLPKRYKTVFLCTFDCKWWNSEVEE